VRSTRIAVYLLVAALAAIYLLSLLMVALNSLRSTPEIVRNGMIGIRPECMNSARFYDLIQTCPRTGSLL